MPAYMPLMPTTYKPIDSAAGLTTGYTNDRKYLPQQPGAAGDYTVLDNFSGLYKSIKTGLPWSGPIIVPNSNSAPGTLGYAQNGMPVTADGKPITGSTIQNPNIPNPDLAPKLTSAVKQPDVVAANKNLLTKQNELSNTLTKSFDDYLSEFKNVAAQSKVQLAADQAAVNTDKISAELPAQDRLYEANQRDISAGIGQTNADYAKATAERIQRLNDENLNFEQRSQAVAGQALDLANKQTALYHLGTGTPTSGSGDLSNRYINAYARINVPLQQQLSDRRYNQINNIEGAATRELYGNDLNYAASRSALESDVSNRNIATLKYLQGLRLQVAGMSRSMAAEYLRQLGVPIELGQRIISGDIANLSGIQGIDERANFYGLTQPYDPSRQANVITPGINSPNRNYSPQEPVITGGGYGTRPGGISTVSPNGLLVDVGGGYVRDQSGNTFMAVRDQNGRIAAGRFISAGVSQTPIAPVSSQYVSQSPLDAFDRNYYSDNNTYFNPPAPANNSEDWYNNYYD